MSHSVYPPLAQYIACARLKISPQGYDAGIFLDSHAYRIARPSRNSVFVNEKPYLLRGKALSKLDAPTPVTGHRSNLPLRLASHLSIFFCVNILFSSLITRLILCCEFSAHIGTALYRQSPRELDHLRYFFLPEA